MPIIKKQTPPAGNGEEQPMNRLPAQKAPSVFDRVVPVCDHPSMGLVLLVYGRMRTGKTRLACTFPKPLLLVGAEDGTESVKRTPGVDFIQIATTGELEELVEGVRGGVRSHWRLRPGDAISVGWEKIGSRTGAPYASFAIDTAGGLQDLVTKEFLGLDSIPVQRSWGMANKQDWGAINMQCKERLNTILRLAPAPYRINVCIIAHERNFGEESDDSDVMKPYVGAALSPGTAAWLDGQCNCVGQMYIREAYEMVEKVVAGKATKVRKQLDRPQHCLRVCQHARFKTGFRLPEGVELPEYIVNPTYPKLRLLIEGKPIPPDTKVTKPVAVPAKSVAVPAKPAPKQAAGGK
jgi:hypothetical protein